jgi:hypothetical protein
MRGVNYFEGLACRLFTKLPTALRKSASGIEPIQTSKIMFESRSCVFVTDTKQ